MQIDEKVKSFCQKEYQTLTNSELNPAEIQKNTNTVKIQVQSGQSNGRWTREEHLRFVEGLSLYGKNWKQVEDHVQTRTGAQIRSHAQKFFNRLEREYQKQQNTKNIVGSSGGAVKYNFRKRYESFDSTASYDPISEDVGQHNEEKISPETLNQVLPKESTAKKDIKGWIDYYQKEEGKLMKIKEENGENMTIENKKQNDDNINKIQGIIKLLSAYDNIQDIAQQQYQQKFTQQQQNIKKEPVKCEEKKPTLTAQAVPIQKNSPFSNFPQFGKNSIEEQILGENPINKPQKKMSTSSEESVPIYLRYESPTISHDQSFFQFIFQKYWKTFENNGKESVKLSQLVELESKQDINSNNEIEDSNNNNNNDNSSYKQQYKSRRKSSFALKNDNGTEQEKEQKLEKLKKLVKTENNSNNNNNNIVNKEDNNSSKSEPEIADDYKMELIQQE